MAPIRSPSPVKPICAITFAPEIHLETVIAELEPLLGKEEDRSPIYPFIHTTYYKDEMGEHLQKVFLSFCELQLPDQLVLWKIKTNKLEEKWTFQNKRKVNLDPGYLTSAKLVMASTKDFAHRIFLGQGIYGDLQLQFRHGKWHPHPWTFPDYQTELAFAFFEKVRNRFVEQERTQRHAV